MKYWAINFLFITSFALTASEFNIDINSNSLLNTPSILPVSDTLEKATYLYVAEEYGNNWFSCGTTAAETTPDQKLKSDYLLGKLNNIITFSSTSDIISYTPIRAMVNTPDRPALFKGYYFISQ